ncbi:MAG: zinc-binding dehydrogenase [Promicromonosporaceae bacterium]|nr:zinc-binding dehydrogenase [Promicromonosporaceae bacterium]
MLTTKIYGPRDIRVEEVPDPVILTDDDAVLRTVACCVCGSDLWPYRGISQTVEPHGIGHELIATVEALGKNVTSVKVGDFVIVPFSLNDGTCQECLAGETASCQNCTFMGGLDRQGHPMDGAQTQMVRIPLAQASLFPVGLTVDEARERGLIPHLLTLADVMSTGYHAALGGQVKEGDVVAVVGDGAVGLCAVIAAKLRGATRIIAMSRHEDRAALARRFGATDVVAERGAEAADAIKKLLDGDLVDVALECVGTQESMEQAFAVTRGGGRIGFVGVPHGPELNINEMFSRNIAIGGGMASARVHMEELLPKVLSGEIEPGLVFDLTLPLTEAPEAYKAMDERRAIKVLLEP